MKVKISIDMLLAVSSVLLLLTFGASIKSSSPSIQSISSIRRVMEPIKVSKFMNNSFKEKTLWNNHRLSYQNTLSVYTFNFPKYISEPTIVAELPLLFKNNKLDSHRMESIFTKRVQFVEALDVYINVAQFFFHGNKQYYDRCICTSYRWFRFPSKFTTVTDSYDIVIGFQHPYFNYGHFVFDQFAYLLLLPPNIVKDAMFIYRGNFDYVFTFFGILGVPPSHVICTDISKIFHAQRYYYFTPPPCRSENALANQLLSKLLRTNCSISEDGKIKPWRFIFYNREVAMRRIDNDLEHIECFQALVPDGVVFQIVGDFRTQTETALFYYEVELMFSVHGSIFPVLLYMQKGTIYVERHILEFFSAATSLAYSLGVHSVLVFSREANRWASEIEIKVSLSEYVMKSALEMVIY